MDEQKVQAVVDWPTSQSVQAVRSFLSLAGYYRKFIRDYDAIAAPLTKLLKEAFAWVADADQVFRALKEALTTAPVLQLLDFAIEFIVECDAFEHVFGGRLALGHRRHRLLQQARQNAPCQACGIRMRAHWPCACSVPLAPIFLGS